MNHPLRNEKLFDLDNVIDWRFCKAKPEQSKTKYWYFVDGFIGSIKDYMVYYGVSKATAKKRRRREMDV